MRRALVLVLAVATTLTTGGIALAALPATGHWKGSSNELDAAGKPEKVSFDVTKAKPRVLKQFSLPYGIDCDGGTHWLINFHTTFIKAKASGQIAAVTTFSGELGAGRTAQHGFSINGHFTSRKAVKGTIEDVVSVRDTSGKQVDTCHSGTVRFSAKLS